MFSPFYYTVMHTNGQITMFPVQPSLLLSAKDCRTKASKIVKKNAFIFKVEVLAVAYPGIFFGGGSTNSVEDRGQRGRDLGAVAS